MSFPYLSDLLNAVFGTALWLPIPMFGLVVVLAIVIASVTAASGARWQESQGRLPDRSHEIVADLALVCALSGIVGARIFYIADHMDELIADPLALIFTRSGFSIYGGLCFGVAAGIVFLKRRSIPVRPMLDAVAPSLMLGYGIGRLGCQLAGDGDWGVAADLSSKPGWIPDWLWAQSYEGNILGVTVPAPGVYPTPLYEFAAAMLLFGALWFLRSPRQRPGYLFSVYLLLAGFERLLIEKIRINVEHDVFGFLLTQAELISLFLVAGGLLGILLTLNTRTLWVKALVSVGVISALSACVPW